MAGGAVLDGVLAAEARRAVHRIAAAIAAAPSQPGDGAEWLLFWSQAAGVLGEAAVEPQIDQAIEQVNASLAEDTERAGLVRGLAGTGLVIAEVFADADTELVAVDDALIALIPGAPASGVSLDLAGGLTGLGVYFLHRPGSVTARAGLQRIIERLTSRAERDAGGVFWRAGTGAVDTTTANGVAGIVGFLARVEQAGCGGEAVRQMLAGAAHRLAAQPRPDCETAAAVWSAGAALDDRVLQSAGLEQAIDAGEATVERCSDEPLGLIGGAGWLAHLYDRFHRATADGYFRVIAAACFAEVVGRLDGRGSLGVWYGAGGGAVAVCAALDDGDPGWSRLVLADPRRLAVRRVSRAPEQDPGRTNVDGLTVANLEQTRAQWWTADFTGLLLASIPEPGGRIVDLGCGLAQVGLTVLPSRPAATYIGIDLDGTRLATAARALAAARLAARTSLVCGRGEALPLATASADVVTSTLTFQHVADPAIVLAEVRRVLRPGGALVVVEPDHLELTLAFDGELTEVAAAMRVLGERSRDAHRPADLSIGPRMAGLIAAAGFTAVETEPWTCASLDRPMTVTGFACYLRHGVTNLARRARLALDSAEVQAALDPIDRFLRGAPPRHSARARRTMMFYRCRAVRPD